MYFKIELFDDDGLNKKLASYIGYIKDLNLDKAFLIINSEKGEMKRTVSDIELKGKVTEWKGVDIVFDKNKTDVVILESDRFNQIFEE